MLYHTLSRLAGPSTSILAIAAIALPSAALAQNTRERTPAASQANDSQDDFHTTGDRSDPTIVVSAVGVTQLDVLAGTSVMQGVELQRSLDGQLGETLAKLPGVSATSFSPGASRPVLRGFSGERVKVLVDGIGAIDVSNTSADHAVSIDPLTAERIEVLRGPAVMLYGSQAIGGAVNVIDKRIPLRRLDEPFHLDARLGANTAANMAEGGLSLDVPAGEYFVFHVDGSYRRTEDLEIPGFVASDSLRAELLAEADADQADEPEEAAELQEAANLRGVLPNSATETYSANAGFAFFAGESNLGAAIGLYDTTYGVPTRPGTGHAHGEEGGEEDGGEEEEGAEIVTIGLRQYRADMRGELALGGGIFSQLRTRFGYSDYTHTEFEGEEVGTTFDVQGFEARAELVQNQRGTWNGVVGTQYYFRDFSAEGAEAYIPPNLTSQIAAFALQEVAIGPVQLEFAGRYEGTEVESQQLGFIRDFDSWSGAVSLAHETAGGFRFGVTGSRVERAPSAEELLSNGPHIATQAFEIGDLDLDVESAFGVEAFMRGRIGLASVNVAVYKNWFSNYIYLEETGLEEDDLPVFQYLQDDAEYFGVEGEISLPLIDSGPFSLLADLRGDYVRAKLDDGSALPRIPPLSLLGALEAKTERFDVRAEVQWSDSQTRLAAFETPTDSFTFVNASVAWKPIRGDDNLTLMLQADNIFDVEGRRHASFTKDFVPLAGRNFRISAKASF
ncbi:TonB-dependent receptor [Allopontixanthobacter sediminis]|uniref:TonB-dependent receptor n=1 Tax=Allopontixanthobacter sediminis TaxID=1689985 RepID=A0A845B0Z9_9SPHN|nr:TonB-dependent receptor [Allopontixanthobacter sediminis]MXP44205.1 TonB-dependent receptor [Allopontixanthobacter sediminis]